MKACPLCQQPLPRSAFRYWGGEQWCCHPCYLGYCVFRRAFKKERGRFPTVAEFREDL